MNYNFKPQLVDGVQLIKNKTLLGRTFYVLACEKHDKYIKVPENKVQYIETALKIFNGNMTMSEIKKLYPNVRFEQLYEQLKRAGFIEGYEIPKNEIDIMTNEIVAIKLDKFSMIHKKALSTYAAVMQTSYFILFFVCITIMVFTGIDIQELKTGFATYQNSVFGGVLVLFTSSIFFTFLHELSHITVAIMYGKHVEKISLNLYFGLLPMCYVKCKGLNTLQTKYKLHVVMAGVITNFMVALISITVLSMNILGPDAESVFKLFFWGNIFSVFSNLIPTSLSDGYFVLSIFLGKYDMKMFLFKDLFTKNRKLSIKDFICYFLYTVFLLLSIIVIFYSALLWVKDLVVGADIYVQNIVVGVMYTYIFFMFGTVVCKILKMRRAYEK